MSTKYTSGKWVVKEIGDSAAEIIAEETQVAFVKYSNGEAEGRATAYLIAAAQELLEALKGIIEIGKRNLENPKYDGYFDAARAAIAAAEGKEPEQHTGEPDPTDLARDYNEVIEFGEQPTPYDP